MVGEVGHTFPAELVDNKGYQELAPLPRGKIYSVVQSVSQNSPWKGTGARTQLTPRSRSAPLLSPNPLHPGRSP